jgi:hypothetical protein
MNDTFKDALTQSIEKNHVPPFNFAVIEDRAGRAPSSRTSTRKRSWMLTALVIAAPLAAAAGVLYPSPAVRQAITRYFDRHYAAIPTMKNVPRKIVFLAPGVAVSPERAAHDARFHLVMPTGLPAGTRLTSLTESGQGAQFDGAYRLAGGEVINFEIKHYAPPTAHEYSYIAPVEFIPHISQHNGKTKVQMEEIPAHVWIVGDESVFVYGRHLGPQLAEEMKSAMHGHDQPMGPARAPSKR